MNRSSAFHECRRRNEPAPPASTVTWRESLARAVTRIAVNSALSVDDSAIMQCVANKLRYDDKVNVEMVDVLTKAGYDPGPHVTAADISKLIQLLNGAQ